MARFLFTAWPYAGCLHPQIAVAKALAARGHEVAFYTGGAVRPRITTEGFTHIPFGRQLEEQVNALLLSPDGICKAWRHPWRRCTWLRRFIVDTVPLQLRDLDGALARWSPHAMITEPALYAPFLVLQETRRARVAVLEYSFSMLPGRNVPLAGLGWRPPRSWPAQVRRRIGEATLRALAVPIRRGANQVRRRHGLPPLRHGIMELLDRVPLTLVPSCPEFDFDRDDLPPTVHYVGPCVWFPEADRADDLTALPRDRPLVHVTEGTLYAAQPTLLKASLAALSDLPVQVVAATGSQRDQVALALGRPAANVLVKAWVDYRSLLPRTAVVVTIGGGGTVLAALSAGVPLVVVPMVWDQADNAARVVEAGAGISLSPRQCTPRRLRAAVLRVIEDPSYRANAQRLAGALNARPGPPAAARLLEQLAAS